MGLEVIDIKQLEPMEVGLEWCGSILRVNIPITILRRIWPRGISPLCIYLWEMKIGSLARV